MKYNPYWYQEHTAQTIIDQQACGLFLDMGLGKTVITLTAINELIYNYFEVSKVLVIAPLRVAAHTWPAELAKWDHLKGLTLSKILGTAAQRKKALAAEADIYIINRENTKWLVEQYQKKKAQWPFDMLVIDEISSFKSPGSDRFRALRKVTPLMPRRVGLTGTPAPNGYIDLWSQIYLLDQGARLGTTVSGYQSNYFYPAQTDWTKHIVYKWGLQDGAKEAIDEEIKDLCISMAAKDYIEIPERIDVTRPVIFTPEQRQLYDRLERDYLITIDQDTITAGTAAAVTGKLQQFSQGAAYTTDIDPSANKGEWTHIHDAKLDALEDLIEAANGQPVMVFYWFKHDLERLVARFPKARTLRTTKDIDDWNAKEIPVLFVHPASAGHGLNIQEGGNQAIWFALPWSLELYQQANARINRQGQPEKTVVIQHLVAEGTVDEDIMRSLARKDLDQNGLIEALKARIERAQEE